MAFVSSLSPTTFVGRSVTPSIERQRATISSSSSVAAGRTAKSRRPSQNVRMSYSSEVMEDMLAKYDTMHDNEPNPIIPPPKIAEPAPVVKPSSIWAYYVKTMRSRVLPAYVKGEESFGEYISDMRALARGFTSPGLKPVVSAADQYMAASVQMQYKRTAVSTGVYDTRCTEGTVALMAEDSRVASLAARFRASQRPASVQFGDLFAMRSRAIANAHLCSYEESLHCNYSATATATVKAGAESIGACARSATPTNPTDKYMAASVDRQGKMQAVPNGVYGVICSDGGVRNMAEYKRVAALAAKFRSAQLSDIASYQRDYDRSKYARDNYAHMCSYEEDLFNKYPDMAASMSGQGATF